MESSNHSLAELFRQLGLPDHPTAIDAFITSHRLGARVSAIEDAPFWTPTQRAFLREATSDDADWAEVVDALSARLH